MGKQVNHNDINRLRGIALGFAIVMFIFSVIAFFSGFLVDLRNISNFKNVYEVEAIPVGKTLPHIFASQSYPCIVYEFVDKDGIKQSARFYNQTKIEEVENLINAAEPITLKYAVYLYPKNYNAKLWVGSYFTIICFVISVLSFGIYIFMLFGKKRDPRLWRWQQKFGRQID